MGCCVDPPYHVVLAVKVCGLPIDVAPLTRDLVLLIGGAGVGLGVLGSWISVRTYLIR